MAAPTHEKTIYLLLTRTTTSISRLIHFATNAEYTHSSLSIDGPAGPFYSFGRKHPNLLFPAGFVKEQISKGYYGIHPQTPCVLYALKVSAEAYGALKAELYKVSVDENKYHYNILGLLGCLLSVDISREHYCFCSEFVARMLQQSGAADLKKPSSLVQPKDFRVLKQANLVYCGEIGGILSKYQKEVDLRNAG